MITVIVQIGNSDDKLRQEDWAFFQKMVSDFICMHTAQIHFSGHSNPAAAWQNACWVFLMHAADIPKLKNDLRKAAVRFKQDSIALTIGETEFVTP